MISVIIKHSIYFNLSDFGNAYFLVIEEISLYFFNYNFNRNTISDNLFSALQIQLKYASMYLIADMSYWEHIGRNVLPIREKSKCKEDLNNLHY